MRRTPTHAGFNRLQQRPLGAIMRDGKDEPDKASKRLRILMFCAASVHLGLCLWSYIETLQTDWKIPRSIHFNTWRNPTLNAPPQSPGSPSIEIDEDIRILKPATHKLNGSLSLGGLCAGFHFLSFFFVGLQAILLPRNFALTNITDGVNFFRWIEYSISAPVMIIIIVALSGSFDVPLQITVCSLTTVTMFCGLGVELVRRISVRFERVLNSSLSGVPKRGDDYANAQHDLKLLKIILHATGCVCQTAVWLPIFMLLWTSLDKSLDEAPGDIKVFVIAINLVVAFLFICFGFVQLGSLYKRGNSPGLASEYAYVILSLVSKTILGVLLFVGVLVREEMVEIDDF